MPRHSTRKKGGLAKEPIVHEASSGNVFADVGLPEDYLAKSKLVMEISRIISDRDLTEKEAAKVLGIGQSRVSALLRGKLSLFSIEKLAEFVKELGDDVVIHVRPAIRTRNSQQGQPRPTQI
jgi:predicted XRE-type DNA-binding protein